MYMCLKFLSYGIFKFAVVGSGVAGVEEIMSHPFFVHIDWNMV